MDLSRITEFFGFSPPTPSKKRPASATSPDEPLPSIKRPRYTDDVYRNSPYGASCTPNSKRHSILSPEVELRQASLTQSVTTDDTADALSSPNRLAQYKVPEIPKFGAQTKARVPSKVGTIRLSAIAEEEAGPSGTYERPSVFNTSGPSNEEKWKAGPNKRAFEVAAGALDPKKAVWMSVKEPEYALRDMEIRDGLFQLTDLMQKFAEEYFAFEMSYKVSGKLSTAFFEQFGVETAKVIGCVASGGPGGVQGWHDLFLDTRKRQALSMAIIGNVLVEQVFQHIFFGGVPRHVASMTHLQKTHQDADGFDRNKAYALQAREYLDVAPKNTFKLPSYFANHVNRIVGVIYTHLNPILTLGSTAPSREVIVQALHKIVTHAGILSLSMRIDPHTAYHFEPLFKEDTYTSKRMECINSKQMQHTNPQIADDTKGLSKQERTRRANLSAAEKKRSKNDEPLTQIVILSGVTAYRLGGWETQDSTITKVKYENDKYADKGLRVRKLTPGLVYCRWGRPRRFRDGKSDDVPGLHGEAWKGGFVEFSRVDGVVDWLSVEREERETNLTAAKGKEIVGEPVTDADVQELLAADYSE